MVNLIYLLDTNAISEPLRPVPNTNLLTKLREHAESLAIPAVVWHELLYGARRLPESRRRASIERYLFEIVQPTIPILPYDESAAHWHAIERVLLVQQGRSPSFADGQIASIAAVRGLTLVTANTADFEAFHGLALENWLA